MKPLLSLLATSIFCVGGFSQEISKSDASPEFYYLKLECDQSIRLGLEFEVTQESKSFMVTLEKGNVLALPIHLMSKNSPVSIEMKNKRNRVNIELSKDQVRQLKKNTVRVLEADYSYTGLKKPRGRNRYSCIKWRMTGCPSF